MCDSLPIKKYSEKNFKKVFKQALKDSEDHLIQYPDQQSELFPELCSIIKPAKNRWWYAVPESLVTPYYIRSLKEQFDPDRVDVNTYWHKDGYRKPVVVWSYECLLDQLTNFGTEQKTEKPSFMVLDLIEAMVSGEKNLLMAEILFHIPSDIQVVGIISFENILTTFHLWMTQIRKKTCHAVICDKPKQERMPNLLTDVNNPEFLPLIDKKRVSLKVKRFLKEKSTPFKHEKKLDNLISYLRKQSRTPAIVVTNISQPDKYLRRISFKETVIEECLGPDYQNNDDFDLSLLTPCLTKGSGVVDNKMNFKWNEYSEWLFSKGKLDILFTHSEYLKQINTPAQTVVLIPLKNSKMNTSDIFHIHRLLNDSPSSDDTDILVIPDADADLTQLKDLFVSFNQKTVAPFKINFSFVLSLLSSKPEDPFLIVEKLFDWKQIPSDLHNRIIAMFEELKEELPERKCSSSFAALVLKDLLAGFTQKINELENQIRTEKSFRDRFLIEEQINRIKEEQNLLPCQTCSHSTECHRRGHRKLRELMNEFYDLKDTIIGTFIFAKLQLEDYIACLRELTYIDGASHLTDLGTLALQVSENPILLSWCIHDGLFNQSDDPCVNVSISGAFVKTIGGYSDAEAHDDLIFHDISEIFEQLEGRLSSLRQEMYRFGICLPLPNTKYAMPLMAWQMGMDLSYILSRTNMKEGAFMELFYRANYLFNRIQDVSGMIKRQG